MDTEEKIAADKQQTGKKAGKAKKDATPVDIDDKVETLANPQTLDDLEAMYSDDEYKKDKKKKAKPNKKAGGGQKVQAENAANQEGGDETPKIEESDVKAAAADDAAPKVKTAAEKRKEKKEREKAKKAATAKTDSSAKPKESEKSKPATAEQNDANSTAEAEAGSDAKQSKPEPDVEQQPADGDAEAKENEDGGAEAGTEGLTAAQKKKLKKKEKDKAKKAAGTTAATDPKGADAKKKPTSAVAKLIKQQLEKQKEEEEKIRQQEEEAERKREEERQKREEEERLERERKEKRKAKMKEKKQKMKEEGRLLTEKQKQDRRRLQQMLDLKDVELPAAAADEAQPEEEKKKKPKYQRLKRNRGPAPGAAANEVTTPTEQVAEQAAEEKKPEQAKPVEKDLADDWEQEADDTWTQMEAREAWEHNDEIVRNDAEEGRSDDDHSASDSDDDDEDESSSSEPESEGDPAERARHRIDQRRQKALANTDPNVLRCPLVCVLGHVDTGKTSILDKLRRTHVQDGEAGGITQQIGATNVPAQAILGATRMVKSLNPDDMILPGLLIIDTPGHESFSNLRSRGSSLCDVAILVVDIMHGIEPQTIESIQLLKKRGTPFIVALNKIDRLYSWQRNPNVDVYNTLKKQEPTTKNDFNDRLKQVVAQFAMHELNVCLSCDNKNPEEYISLVPTSAHSGDGMGNLMAHICELSLRTLRKHLAFHEDLEATVMEVKEITGLGTTIDVCLVNGRLHEGDTIILAGQEGPIVTQVRGLLMPMPMKEMRVKNSYEKFKEVQGAQAVKIIAKDLEKALAGLPLYRTKDHDEIEVYKADVSAKLRSVLKGIEVQDTGVYVQASTLGSLEALLLFLRTEKIPYCGINIGPVHKRDVTRCSVMLEKDIQWAVILAFDVKVEREAQELADSLGVKIFTADIIYHLSDAFMKWREDRMKAEKDKYRDVAVFPCKLRILPQYIFNTRDPIVCGVVVEAGIVRTGTPIAVPSKECVYLGKVDSIELNHRKIDEAKRGAEVCIKIAAPSGDAPKLYGRHFDHNDLLCSRLSRDSIDALKQYFRDDLQKEDWKLVIELKKAFDVM